MIRIAALLTFSLCAALPIERGDARRTADLKGDGGLRFPHLEKTGGGLDMPDALNLPRS